MADYDPEMGRRMHQHLLGMNLETPMKQVSEEDLTDSRSQSVLEGAHRIIMEELGLDLSDDSLMDTPRRVAKMYQEELFYGLDYAKFPKATVFKNSAHYDEMLAVTVSINSFCEHHFLPFIGKAHIAYIPSGKFLGLSKFNRIADFFARRPQVQERLTEQISAAFIYLLDTKDVAVVIKAEHFCSTIRGVKDSCGDTISSKLCGKFRDVPELRQEFISLTRS